MSTVNITLNPRDRLELSTTIENLINMLDELSPDPDLEDDYSGEPWLGWPDARGLSQLASSAPQDDREADTCDDEATALERHGKGFYASGADDSEENEDGGDINGEPHDRADEGNDEPWLGWTEKCGQGPRIGMDCSPTDVDADEHGEWGPSLYFTGSGYDVGRQMLRKAVQS